MARRDVINFNFLKKAIEQRYRFRNNPNNINYKSFRGIPFEPQTDPHSILGRIYTTFRELSRTKHLILNQYLNLEDKSVLEKLFQNLERDPNLRFLNIPDAALNDSRYELSDQYYLEQSKEIAAAQQAEQMPSAAAPTGSSTGGMPGMPSFSAPSIATRPRMVRNIPQAEAESQKLFVANSSGAIVGEKEITPTGVRSVPQGPSEIVLTDRNDKEIGKLSANPTAKISGSEPHIDKSGNITETRAPGRSAPTPTPQPKLIVTDRHGNPAPQPLKRPETAKLFTQDKNNIIREHTVKSPSRFSGFKSSLKNIGSRAGVFFQRNIGKHLTGDRAMSLLGKAGNTGINALSGITNLGGRPGGILSHLGRFNRSNGGRGFFGRFGKGGGQKGSLAGKVKGRGGMIFAAGIIGSMVLVGGMAAFAPNPAPGEAAPLPTNNFGLDYTLPLRDPTIQPLDIKSAILSQFPKAQIDNWDIIVQKSIDAGWNPALVLALWIEESGAQGKVDNQGNPLYDDPLGCAPKQKTTDINISLKCLFDNFSSYTNDQFITFMTRYGGGTPGQSLAGNDNFPKFPNVVKDWYSRLVPTGPGAIVAVAPSSAPQQQFVTSCPIPNGKITCGSSKGVPGIPACHCTDSYSPRCDPLSRRGKAIDVTGPNGSKDNDPVYMPLINGRLLKWYFRGDFDDGYHATLRVFQSEPTPDGTWTIHFVHSKRRINLLKIKDDFTAVPVFSSGQEITDLTQPVAYTDQNSSDDGVGIHTHVSIGLLGNVDWQADQLQYLNQGWKYADADMKMCQ